MAPEPQDEPWRMAPEVARRLGVSVSWLREKTRAKFFWPDAVLKFPRPSRLTRYRLSVVLAQVRVDPRLAAIRERLELRERVNAAVEAQTAARARRRRPRAGGAQG
jgi:hypothetical protein